jgi:hypothetical protein
VQWAQDASVVVCGPYSVQGLVPGI